MLSLLLFSAAFILVFFSSSFSSFGKWEMTVGPRGGGGGGWWYRGDINNEFEFFKCIEEKVLKARMDIGEHQRFRSIPWVGNKEVERGEWKLETLFCRHVIAAWVFYRQHPFYEHWTLNIHTQMYVLIVYQWCM